MQPNTSLQPGLIDNTEDFTDPFFMRFAVRPAPASLKLAEGVSKTYSFPTFYVRRHLRDRDLSLRLSACAGDDAPPLHAAR